MLRRGLPLLLLALAWTPDVPAAMRWFDLEVVVFARDGLPSGNEVWPQIVDLPDTALARQPDTRITPRRLAGAVDRLRRQPGYRVLLHTAWRQPTGNRSRVPWIRLTDGSDVTATPSLDGMVRLSLRRYLHVDLDLVVSRELEMPVAAPQPETGAVAIPLAGPDAPANTAPSPAPTYRRVLQPFRMVDSRRMRSDELHYIDHPAFGVLLLATAYQPPTPTEPTTPVEEPAGTPLETPAETGTSTSPAQPGSPPN